MLNLIGDGLGSGKDPYVVEFAEAKDLSARVNDRVVIVVGLHNSVVTLRREPGLLVELDLALSTIASAISVCLLNEMRGGVELRVVNSEGEVTVEVVPGLLAIVVLKVHGLVSGLLVPSSLVSHSIKVLLELNSGASSNFSSSLDESQEGEGSGNSNNVLEH